MRKIIFLFLLSFFQFAFSQQTETFKIRKYKVAELSDSVRENSGLDFVNGKLYTFNDSGNTSELFELEKTSGKILKTIKTNLKNKDWEAMTSDSANVYIGDFGNNAGKRKDLKIYKIPFENDSLQLDSIKTISFYYPEQTDFTSKYLKNDFDAEAMIFHDGKIHLFTKEWTSKSTTHYILNPKITENQPAEKTETFRTDFVVTDAAYFDKKLYLVGYTKKTEVFLCVFREAESGIFFRETPLKYYLGSALTIGQIEGIAVDENGIYISGEEFKSPLGKVKQSFYFIPKDEVRLRLE